MSYHQVVGEDTNHGLALVGVSTDRNWKRSPIAIEFEMQLPKNPSWVASIYEYN